MLRIRSASQGKVRQGNHRNSNDTPRPLPHPSTLNQQTRSKRFRAVASGSLLYPQACLGAQRQHRVRCSRLVARSFQQDGVEVPDGFRAALQQAMSRNRDVQSEFNSSSSYGGYERSAGYSRPPQNPAAAAANASPLLQILATALGQSRATLERLQAEEAEIENLIQKEQKQVERLEWLLETVQKDYAYFNYLQKRFEDETGGSANRW